MKNNLLLNFLLLVALSLTIVPFQLIYPTIVFIFGSIVASTGLISFNAVLMATFCVAFGSLILSLTMGWSISDKIFKYIEKIEQKDIDAYCKKESEKLRNRAS